MDFSLFLVIGIAAGMFYVSFPQQAVALLGAVLELLSNLVSSLWEFVSGLKKGG